MSRRRLPDNVLQMRGTFRPHRHGAKDKEPMLPPTTLEPPDWLPELPAKEWRRVVQVLAPSELLTEGDAAILLAYTLLFADVQAAGKFGAPVLPALVAQLRLCASELGLTPTSRQRLATTPKQKNEFGEFDPPPRPTPSGRT
ncbi:MAG: hypothetical protein R3F24_05110 [Gammaproteobacteria bacterium]